MSLVIKRVGEGLRISERSSRWNRWFLRSEGRLRRKPDDYKENPAHARSCVHGEEGTANDTRRTHIDRISPQGKVRQNRIREWKRQLQERTETCWCGGRAVKTGPVNVEKRFITLTPASFL